MKTSVTGTITVENGVVVEMDSEIANQAEPTSVDKATLHTILRDLQNHGWGVDGELPPYTTQGRYVINLKKKA